jgi:hypothetical protein
VSKKHHGVNKTNAGKNTSHYTNSFIKEGTCDDKQMREASLFSFLKSHEEIFLFKKA